MPLLRINATQDGLALHDTSQPARLHLRAMVHVEGPAILMLHGYKYEPDHHFHCPHTKLFGPHRLGWPRALGFGKDNQDEGLGIPFGWNARGSLRQVYARATALGTELANVIKQLREKNPSRSVHVIAHSLGAQATLSAMMYLPADSVDRVILLSGASYASFAHKMLATPAGQSAEVLNVTSRENDIFDAAFERLAPSKHSGDHAIGRGIHAPNVANLQLDCHDTLARMERLGFLISPANRRVCHWSSYTRPGVMTLYDTFLRHPHALPLQALINLLPDTTAPRWSRLWPPATPKTSADSDASFPRPALPLRSARYLQRLTVTRNPENEPAY
ncbi:MAG: alpha/beta hydrolase [Pseudomonadota bacterium]